MADAESQICHIVIILVIGEADMIKHDMLPISSFGLVLPLEIKGHLEDLFNAARARGALGIHHEDTGNH